MLTHTHIYTHMLVYGMGKKLISVSLDEELIEELDQQLEGKMPRSWYLATLIKKDLKKGGIIK